MNENIDLTKILKDCPKGWKFYSSIYGDVKFYRIEKGSEYPVKFLLVDKDTIEGYGNVTEQGFYAPYYNGECTLFPSKDQRDWSKFTAPWYKKEKFDPKTFKAFDRVIVRNEYDEWTCTLFSHIRNKPNTRFICATCESLYIYCLPYNDDTKHLIGTTEEAPEYYRYWED